MFEYILTFLSQNHTVLPNYIFVMTILSAGVWKAAKFYMQTDETNSRFPRMEELLLELRNNFVTLNRLLVEKQIISQSCFSKENSPRTINQIGKRVLEQSSALQIYEEIKKELLKDLRDRNPKSLLEVEQKSLDVLLKRAEDPRFKDIQDFVFEHPSFEKVPLTYTDLLFIISLKLRDDYRLMYPDLEIIRPT